MTDIDYKKLDLTEIETIERELKKAKTYKRNLAKKSALTQITQLMKDNSISFEEIQAHQSKGNSQGSHAKTKPTSPVSTPTETNAT